MALRGCVNFYHTHRHKQDHLLNGLYRTPVIAPQCTSKKYKPSLRDSAGLVNALHMAHHAWRGGQEEKDVEKGISGAARAL